MDGLTSNQPLVIIAVTLISSLTTIIVAVIGQRVAKKVKTRPPTSAAGYERLLNYLEGELKKKDGEIEELQTLVETTRDRLREVAELSDRRREKLLEVSRQYGVDVSALV